MKLQDDYISKLRYFWSALFDWHTANGRDFPWRSTNNAYFILVAEILLQQTNARKVAPVYEGIVNLYPTPLTMLNAGTSELKKMIEPIGLFYRAERLINIACQLCTKHDGIVPNDREQLLALPGVGSYIADAVLCYAYNHSTVPVDTNVIRLFTRYFGLTYNSARARDDKRLAEKIKGLFNYNDTKPANLAVLDFASAVCKARLFDCSLCILKLKCIQHSKRFD